MEGGGEWDGGGGGGESGMGGKWTKSREDPMTCHLS